MKYVFKIILLLLSFHAGIATGMDAPDKIDTDMPLEYKEQYELAEEHRNNEDYEKAHKIYDSLREKLPKSFSVAYGYGYLLAQMKLYEESEEMFNIALNLGINNKKIMDFTIYNSRGWISVMNGKYNQALEYFEEALEKNAYSNVSENTRMKIHNNKGYTLMLLDRYEESLVEFKKASNLGSEKAKYNIKRVNSIIETQKQQDQNIAGIFAPVIFSLKNKEKIAPAIKHLVEQYGLTKDKLKAYVSETGIYIITYGSNYSYPKALKIKEDMVKKGIKDAYVYSTISWELYNINTTDISVND